jgi:hypothetical protein
MPEFEAEPEVLPTAMRPPRRVRRWPLFLIAAPAAIAVWSGWVGLGGMCGFGLVQSLPGITGWHLNTAITLPIGVESYGAYALGAWLTPDTSATVRKFARRSAIGSLCLGVLGQVAYHLLAAAHQTEAPWPVTVFVACLPVVTLGFAAALTHLLRDSVAPETTVQMADETAHGPAPAEPPASRSTGAFPSVFVGDETADETVQEPGLEGVPEAAPELESPQATLFPSLVPADAERAAETAMRATFAAGNPFTLNQLSSRFKLTRPEATRVRDRVLAEANGHRPGELADSAVS